MKHFTSELDPSVFIPAAELTELRRKAIAALDAANDSTYPYSYRKNENAEAMYMTDTLDYRDNVANRLAEQFYREHGVKKIERAIETAAKAKTSPLRVMTTRHCILRELRMCKKENRNCKISEPLRLSSGRNAFTLEFNCRDCEMHLVKGQ